MRVSCIAIFVGFSLPVGALQAVQSPAAEASHRDAQQAEAKWYAQQLWAERAEAAESGQGIDESPQEVQTGIQQATKQLEEILPVHPDDTGALLLLARLGRAEIMASPIGIQSVQDMKRGRTSVRAADTVTCSLAEAGCRTISRLAAAVAPALQDWRAKRNPSLLISTLPDVDGTAGNTKCPWE